jgi:hypothetical protein
MQSEDQYWYRKLGRSELRPPLGVTDHFQRHDVTKGLKVTMGWNVTIVLGKMDLK